MDFALEATEFIQWEGPPPTLPSEKIETFVRPGVDGVGMRKVGWHATPFPAMLHSVHANYLTALDEQMSYRTFIDLGPLSVIYNGKQLIDYNVKLQALAVEPVLCESRALTITKTQAIYSAGYAITQFMFQPILDA